MEEDKPTQADPMDVDKEESHVDPELADWFKVGGSDGADGQQPATAEADEDSVTESDSDYDEAWINGNAEEWTALDQSTLPSMSSAATPVSPEPNLA